uniref:Fibronectin type III domain-containing protein n=1 Tax=Astatotilapia calliptera TaxID=8154 RepID=A0AAX7VYP5_ASTCA
MSPFSCQRIHKWVLAYRGKKQIQNVHFCLSDLCASAEEGCTHAEVHPGSEHHHTQPVLFRTPKESEKMASKSPDEVTMEEVGDAAQLRAGELIIIVVVLVMWAGVIALFCRQYDIIKDNEPNNNKDKAKNSSECSTPEHPQGGLLRSNV